jgi:hypothetical protein
MRFKLPRKNRRAFLKYKEEARRLVRGKLEAFNKIYGLRYGRIAIRNTKSRWGSCSTKGNLNFNYRIIFLPGALSDYLIIHELCHLKEFNHSKKFWNLVAVAAPDYKKLRKELKVVK